MIRTHKSANQGGRNWSSISLISALIPSYNYENPTNRGVAHQPPTLPNLAKCLRYLTLTQLYNCLDVLHEQFHSFPPGRHPICHTTGKELECGHVSPHDRANLPISISLVDRPEIMPHSLHRQTAVIHYAHAERF